MARSTRIPLLVDVVRVDDAAEIHALNADERIDRRFGRMGPLVNRVVEGRILNCMRIGNRLLWVHRKGVISARAGEPGLVPGSMGTPSFHVEGRGCEASLCSSSHGAGRAMSRGLARRRISVRALEKQMRHVWFDHRLARRLVDEAPGAYKDISAVMRAQAGLSRIVRKLRPVLSFKGC